MIFPQIVQRLKGRFVKDTGLLAGSAAISQGLTLLAYPLLTRLYDPQDFGIMAQFIAILLILQVVAGMRFEIAIPLAPDDEKARQLVMLTILVILITSSLTFLVIITAHPLLSTFPGIKNIASYAWLIPIGMAGGGLFQTLSYWAIRMREFKVLGMTKMWQTVGCIGTQTVSGFAGIGDIGLVIGVLLGQILGSGQIAGKTKVLNRLFRQPEIFKKLKQTIQDYWQVSLSSSCSGIANTFGLQLPFLLMTSCYGTRAGGFFLLASKLFAATSDLLGSAVAQTYYGEASASYRSDRKRFRTLFCKTAGVLSLVGVSFSAIVWLTAPKLIDIFLGKEWHEVGIYAKSLTFLYTANLVCSPLSTTIFIVRKQHIQVLWDLMRIAVVTATLYGSWEQGWDAGRAIVIYSFGVGTSLWFLLLINLIFVFQKENRS